ncbi:hypothetical protein THAOC_06874 [Thalassiosira oceanica]|uniref:Uncharacterized protein n=1 Tax=Thalassiosira oceanica TaxID=159749 RepID=K0T3H2_THAOC|nr:hypothetical protein THAOC_06874 [Thalassiosira oceanica]|eukprot:EJK71664.1 hypothetical protein THAOC_06874 [Thalassiosira oceanica]
MPISNTEPVNSFKPLAPSALFLRRCALYKLTMADRSQICGKHGYFEGSTIDDWIDDRDGEDPGLQTNIMLSANAASNIDCLTEARQRTRLPSRDIDWNHDSRRYSSGQDEELVNRNVRRHKENHFPSTSSPLPSMRYKSHPRHRDSLHVKGIIRSSTYSNQEFQPAFDSHCTRMRRRKKLRPEDASRQAGTKPTPTKVTFSAVVEVVFSVHRPFERTNSH